MATEVSPPNLSTHFDGPGTRSGKLFGSADGGATWITLMDRLPSVVAVQPGR
jgi:hypothetical protein